MGSVQRVHQLQQLNWLQNPLDVSIACLVWVASCTALHNLTVYRKPSIEVASILLLSLPLGARRYGSRENYGCCVNPSISEENWGTMENVVVSKVKLFRTPLRPIVSAIGSLTYRLAKEIARVLPLPPPLQGRPSSTSRICQLLSRGPTWTRRIQRTVFTWLVSSRRS